MSAVGWWEEDLAQRERLAIVEMPDEAERRRALAGWCWERWSAAVPCRFQGASLGGLADKPEVQSRLTAWGAAEEPPNLLIHGPVGTGKTWAALAACRPQVAAGKRLAMWSVGRLMDELDWRNPGAEETMRNARAADVVLLDDLGSERASEWGSDKLYTILNERWIRGRPVVATSNYALEPLVARLGEQAYSRLVSAETVVVRLTGHDRRREGR